MIDYISSADRLGTSLEAKRARSIAILRSRNKYLCDIGCTFVPTKACETDVQQTMVDAMKETINQDCARFAMGVPSLLRRQAA